MRLPHASRLWLVAPVVAALLAILVPLALQVQAALDTLHSAPRDNMQWAMAQAQTELLVLDAKVDEAIHDGGRDLSEVRQRFDILYSRMVTLRDSESFAAARTHQDVVDALNSVIAALDDVTPLIDGSDEELRAYLPSLHVKLGELNSTVRDVALHGVRTFAASADAQRQAFSDLLWRTAMVAVACIVSMIFALLLLVRQYWLLQRRSNQLELSNKRYSSAIGAALDAIVVCDGTGTVLDINPAAEAKFGYAREGAIGASVATLIVPPDNRLDFRASFDGLVQPQGAASESRVRMEMLAMRADGGTFDAEFAFGVTQDTHGPIVISYIRDISARRRFEAALTAARDEALATARAKSNFLAVMSHEMRTPLNGVMGILDLMRRTRLTAKQRKYVETAILSGEILQRHIEDVLDITRIEAGALTLNPSQFELGELLREVGDINRPAATARGNELQIVMGDAPAQVVQDRHCVRQVLINLVGNAVKFTQNGQVIIKAASVTRAGADWLRLTVSDTGIGMSPQDLGRIFEDFVMLDSSFNRTAAGSGLGLGICRRVVGLLGGTISVDSEPNVGSRFTVDVPLLASTPGMARSRSISSVRMPAAVRHDLDVLLVEDNEINRLVAREMLQLHGCRVTEAVDGLEGVERARAHRFDLILMDVSMPRLDGMSATRQIREQPGLSQATTIIGLTAHALHAEQGALRAAGMQGCLVKPLRAEALDALLAEIAAEAPVQARAPAPPASAAAPQVEAALDQDAFSELANMLPGNLLDQQIERFRKELDGCEATFAPARIKTITAAELGALAHRQAGSAAVFGARALHATLIELETAAHEGDTACIPDLCDRIVRLAGQTRAALAEARARHEGARAS